MLQNRNDGRELNYFSCLLFIAFQLICLFHALVITWLILPFLSVFPRGCHFVCYATVSALFLVCGPQWHPVLRTLKNRIEENTGHTFNSLLCNLYRNEKDSVDWHSDDEPSLGRCPTIASLSFGATRIFEMRKKPPPVSILFFLRSSCLLLVCEKRRTPKSFYFQVSSMGIHILLMKHFQVITSPWLTFDFQSAPSFIYICNKN